MFMPAPTLPNIIISPFFSEWSFSSSLFTRSNKVGIVATELLPSLFIYIGNTPGGVSKPYNL